METDRAIDRLTQLTQRVIELARRLKPDRMSIPRRQNDGSDPLPAIPAISASDELA